MYVKKKICLLLVEFLMIVVCKAEHDHPDKKSSDTRYCSSNYKADNENSCEKELRECRDVPDEILSRRIVNMLLSRIKFTEEDSWFNGRVELEGTVSELETLRNFGLGISTLQEVAPILEDVIKTTEFGGVYECGLCLQSLHSQLFNFIDTYKQHIPSIVLGLYLIRMLRDKKCNFRQIVFLGFLCISAVIFTNTLREVEQEVNTKEAPIHCRPDEMSWTDKIMALFASAKNCEKYEKEMNNRPGTILKLTIFRILDRISGQIRAQSINIGFTIIKFFANIQKCRMLINDIPDETLSRGIVNMLLSRTNFREGDSSFHGRVILEATASELETLKNFGLGISTLREASPILNNVIKSGEFDEVDESTLSINSLTSELFNFIETYKHDISIIVSVLYLFRILRNREYDVWLTFSIVLYVVYIVYFVVTLREVLQEENIKYMENMEQVPIHCEPDAMRWTDKIMALVSSAEDCEKYNEAKRNNSLVIKITLASFRTGDRIFRRAVALSMEIALILIKIVAKYLPLLGLFIVRNIVVLIDYSIATLAWLVLAFFVAIYITRDVPSVQNRDEDSTAKTNDG